MRWWSAAPVAVEIAVDPDPQVLADLHAEGFAHAWGGGDMAKLVADPAITVLIARRDRVVGPRAPIGFAMLRIAADEAELLSIAVARRHRDLGIGRKLMEAALRHLFAERVASLFLEVDAGNAPAVALYRRLGFRTVGERKSYYREGRDKPASALVMRYDLR